MSEEKIKVVIDTQIFLRAAINRNSLPAKLLFDMKDKYELVVSQSIVDEIEDVLNRPKIRKKFDSLTDEVVETVTTLLSETEQVNPPEVPEVSRDPKDDKFLACAKSAKAQYVVSEDNDLLVLNPYEDIKIVNALDFLYVLQPKEDAE